LRRKYPIYHNIYYYGIHNFALAILEDLGTSNSVTKEYLLSREQYYLDVLFNNFPDLTLNLSKVGGSTKGYKHKFTKIVYVYNCLDLSLIGEYSIVNCSKEFKLENDTLAKYIKSSLPYKGKIFSREKLN
jgi:hypothetical protein